MLSAHDAARIALALIAEFTTDIQPRGGLCYGEVLTLRGDYYGPIVNLAARLADQAVPGEVLIDTTTPNAPYRCRPRTSWSAVAQRLRRTRRRVESDPLTKPTTVI